jgi:hypothetical protein
MSPLLEVWWGSGVVLEGPARAIPVESNRVVRKEAKNV